MRENADESYDLRAWFAAWGRRAPLILLLTVVGGVLGYGVSSLQEDKYSATASLLFRDPGFEQSLFGSSVFESTDPNRDAATNVRLVSLEVVADLTAEDIGGLTGDDVTDSVSVEQEGQSDVVSATAIDEDPEFAAELANAFAVNYVAFRQQADRAKIREAQDLVETELDSLPSEDRSSDEGDSLRQQLSRLGTLAAIQTGNAEVVQQASVPEDPSSPKPLRNGIIGALIGLVVGLVLAGLLERLDRRLREPEEFEAVYGIPVLSALPESEALGLGKTNGSIAAIPIAEQEALRMLRTQLRYFNVDREIRTVMVTSASPQEGKSTVAWHLARSASEAGVDTVLIDADFHRASVSQRSGLKPRPGLAEFLSGQSSYEATAQEVSLNADASDKAKPLAVITAGTTPPNPVELMESDRMAALLEQLSKDHELVVVDTPPLAVIADAIPLTKIVDGIVVVGQAGATTEEHAELLRQQLADLGAPALGVVANRVQSKRGYYGYGYAAQKRGGFLSRFRRS